MRRFWLREYQNYPARFRAEAIAPIQNKVGEFLVNPILRRIVGQPKSSFDLRQITDEGKILLVNLAKGKIGEDTAASHAYMHLLVLTNSKNQGRKRAT